MTLWDELSSLLNSLLYDVVYYLFFGWLWGYNPF
jgi:hypothetical protein